MRCICGKHLLEDSVAQRNLWNPKRILRRAFWVSRRLLILEVVPFIRGKSTYVYLIIHSVWFSIPWDLLGLPFLLVPLLFFVDLVELIKDYYHPCRCLVDCHQEQHQLIYSVKESENNTNIKIIAWKNKKIKHWSLYNWLIVIPHAPQVLWL